jgi:hypothetical protein
MERITKLPARSGANHDNEGEKRRAVYEKPQLTVLGNVGDLTHVGVSVSSVEAPEEMA